MITAQAQTAPTWIFWLLWMLAFLAFPIGGLVASAAVGPVTTGPRGVFAGAITGAILGLIQWLALKGSVPVSIAWVLTTSAGMALGLGISVAFLGSEMQGSHLLWRAAIAGLCIGAGQWLLLREIFPQSVIWIPVIGLAWTLGWFVTRRIGVDLTPKWSVFGAAGALSFQVVTGLALYFLMR